MARQADNKICIDGQRNLLCTVLYEGTSINKNNRMATQKQNHCHDAIVICEKGLVKSLPFSFAGFLSEHRCDHSNGNFANWEPKFMTESEFLLNSKLNFREVYLVFDFETCCL